MSTVSLPKRHHLPHSNGLSMGMTKTRRMDELLRVLHSYIQAKMQNNDSTSVNSRWALDTEKVKETTSPRRPLTDYAKCLN